MTVIAAIGALATAAFLGYHVGRRAGSPRQTWAKRTSRPALGRLAITLIAMIAARRIQQRLRAERGAPRPTHRDWLHRSVFCVRA